MASILSTRGAFVGTPTARHIRSLLPRDLVDDLLLMIHPLVLGSGHRLFGPDDEAHRLRLVDCTPTAAGVLIATYQPAQRAS